MAAERAKVSQLQNNHLTLSKQLSDAKSLELNQRRELVNYSDEMDEMRKKHGKEVMELEMEVRKKDRELRETTEDLRVARGDLDRERMTVEHLRGALSSQSQSQLTLSAENEALRAQLSSLQRTLVSRDTELQDMRDVVEEKEKLVVEMKKEVFESETIRRKLHNMVLELKGNIRVFCRVRPVLPSDLPSNVEKEEAMAKMAFPDKHDHKDIVLYSTSESAMGVERKDVYNFGFDRVCHLDLFYVFGLIVLSRYSSLNRHKHRFLRRFHSSLKAVLTDTTSAFSHTDKPVLENHSRWKADP